MLDLTPEIDATGHLQTVAAFFSQQNLSGEAQLLEKHRNLFTYQQLMSIRRFHRKSERMLPGRQIHMNKRDPVKW
ncbi:hypothetical protein Plim_0642 [Planctopirus limnophila DSM 3776]|uniref:Uncharacterized protein n=1 Tax=Planctopirus limnophila (strain ATCC 43296 / DSM 3776 / IFAM 1008 / Mu 290) TaxID=521674 RepID=D5SR21_PLAL2|nr:hypothetical protein Plim_0642 [Planctopirus limnophila DSM 3776]